MIERRDTLPVRFTSCRVCGKICQGGICPAHADEARARREAARTRPGPSARGYGPAYRQAKAKLASQLGDGPRKADEPRIRDISDRPRIRDISGTPGIPHIPGTVGISGISCVICREPIPMGDPWTAEHLVPLSRGGRSELANLGPAHPRCNYARRSTR
jgi:hypothetical protein